MNTNLILIILGVSIVSQLIPLLVGRKQNNPLIWYYILTGFSFDIILTICKRVLKIEGFDYHLIGNIFFAVEFLFISAYYYQKIFTSRTLYISALIFAQLAYSLTFLGDTVISGKGIAIFATIYTIYSLLGFRKVLNTLENTRIEKSSFFWVNCALIIYAAGSLPIFIAIDNLLEHNKETAYILWVFRNIINISKTIIFAKVMTIKAND